MSKTEYPIFDGLKCVKYLDHLTDGKTYIVGDIHGCYSELTKLLKYVNFDKTKDRLFSTGDLIDRGKNNIQCLQLVEQDWFHAVLGNHEHMLFRSAKFSDRYMYDTWMNNGGDWAYDLNDMWQSLEFMCDQYISKMPLVIVVGKDTPQRYNIVHAEFYSGDRTIGDVDIDNWTFNDAEMYNMIWGRTLYHYGKGRTHHQIALSPTFSGHTPRQQLEVASSQYFIDTGCVYAVKSSTGSQRVGLTMVDPIAKKYYTWATGDVYATHNLPDLDVSPVDDQQLHDNPWKDILNDEN